MVRVNIPLDPGTTGKEAATLENSLHRMIVGQDEAIQQIVNIYQMHLTGMNAPGRPIGNFLFLGPTGSEKPASWKRQRKPCWPIPARSLRLIARSFSTATKSPS